MLFMYVDDDHNWTYPRAIQDDIHVSARHNWFARVTHIDRVAHTYHTTREKRTGRDKSRKRLRKIMFSRPMRKVGRATRRAASKPCAKGTRLFSSLWSMSGKLVAVEIFDRKGDDAVRAMQDEAHHRIRNAGPARVCQRRGTPFRSLLVVRCVERCGTRQRPQARRCCDRVVPPKAQSPLPPPPLPATRRHPAAYSVCSQCPRCRRLQLGQSLRVFLPNTGPAVPTGRAGFPTN